MGFITQYTCTYDLSCRRKHTMYACMQSAHTLNACTSCMGGSSWWRPSSLGAAPATAAKRCKCLADCATPVSQYHEGYQHGSEPTNDGCSVPEVPQRALVAPCPRGELPGWPADLSRLGRAHDLVEAVVLLASRVENAEVQLHLNRRRE